MSTQDTRGGNPPAQPHDPDKGSQKSSTPARRRRRRPRRSPKAPPATGETAEPSSQRKRRRSKKHPPDAMGERPQGDPTDTKAAAPAAGPDAIKKPRRRRRRRGARSKKGESQAATGQHPALEREKILSDRSRQGFPDEEDWDIQEEPIGARPHRGPSVLFPPETPDGMDADDLVLELEAEHDQGEPHGVLCNMACVRFRDRTKTSNYDAGEINVDCPEKVVVETDQGLRVGEVVRRSMRIMVKDSLPRLIRRIDSNDMRQQARNNFREREAFEYCKERIRQRNLPMKLIGVEYLHGGNRAIFSFAAEHRVDFRELVKDLAQRFHTRIVMRQVGVRDEARMTGGIGSCGCNLCCATWLPKFEPVSIRMAKDQNLVLNPQKVSGQCGRLKCCLTYEQQQYQEARRKLPKPGLIVKTPDGEGRVLELDILRMRVGVALSEGKVQTYPASQIHTVEDSSQAARNEKE